MLYFIAGLAIGFVIGKFGWDRVVNYIKSKIDEMKAK